MDFGYLSDKTPVRNSPIVSPKYNENTCKETHVLNNTGSTSPSPSEPPSDGISTNTYFIFFVLFCFS